jgi:hypothetical protein
MKPILVFVVVVFVIGLVVPSVASGQTPAQTTELPPLTAEQLGEEIAAWKKQLAELVENLSDPTKIWVYLRDVGTVATDDLELIRAVREDAIQRLILYAGESRLLGFRDLRLEVKSLFREDVEASVKETYAELVKQDKAIREIKEKQAERLREIIRVLEKKRADALAAQPRQAGTPAFRPEEAGVSASDIEAVKSALEPIRLGEKWDLRDHGYVLLYLDRRVKTPSQLRLVKKLIADFSACYQAWNAENARIEAAARAGNWIPGKRIGALSQAVIDRDNRLRQIKASFEDAWQAP